MILLKEFYSKDLSDNTEFKTEILILANSITEFLVKTPVDDLAEVRQLFVITDISNKKNLINEELKNFHLDISFYFEDKKDYAYSIYDHFLSPQELIDIDADIKERIQRIINRAQIVSPDEHINPAYTYLCYLPFIKTSFNIISKLDNLVFVEDLSKINKWSINNFVTFSKEEFLKTKETLLQFSTDGKRNKETWEEYSYRHPPFLKNLEHNYFNNLQNIITQQVKRIYFHGAQFLIAEKSIRYFMQDDNFQKYDLRKGIFNIDIKGSKYLFANIDKLTGEEINKFAKEIRPIEQQMKKIAIQGLKIDLDFYLNFYRNIKIPEIEEVQKVITSLFIALLIEQNKIDGDIRMLYNIIVNNGFRVLLKDIIYLSDLKNIITETITSVSVEELKKNPIFWLLLQRKIKEINELHKGIQPIINEEKLDLYFEDGTWTIIINDENPTTIENNYILYLYILLKLWHEELGPVDVEKIRRGVINFEKNVLTKTPKGKPAGDSENDRKNCYKAFNKLKKIYPTFDNFYKNHIDYKNYQYSLKDMSQVKVHYYNIPTQPK